MSVTSGLPAVNEQLVGMIKSRAVFEVVGADEDFVVAWLLALEVKMGLKKVKRGFEPRTHP